MKLSLNWIKEYVEIPPDLELSRISYDLTMSTVEVEGAVDLSQSLNNIVIGIIKEVLPHPNADKLVICNVDIGDGEIKQIVCGGSNCKNGLKVAVAKPGAMLRWHGEGELVEIGIAAVRGEDSYGMICASTEIGLADLFPLEDEEEIIDLSDFDAAAGTALAIALGIDDTILEIDNKSLTNRPDLWGHYGIARELSAIYDLPLKDYVPYTPPQCEDLNITIADIERCPRYVGVRIEGLEVKPSPFHIRSRIWSVGMRPINAIVDITNYVMLATGQPLHAFDSDRLHGNITVRRAKENESFLLLTGKELSLCSEDLVIADDVESIGLAGVMGGVKDSVLADTSKVILEIANFEPISIRRTANRYETRTEAATRNEKGIDPERCDIALAFAMDMFKELYPQMRVSGYSDIYPKPLMQSEIDVSLDWLYRNLGKRIENEEINHKLGLLGFGVSFDGDLMHILSPTWRSTGDITIANDILEEVARMHGLDNFEPTLITTSFEGSINQLDVDIERKIKEYLAFRCGMNEIFTYPWIHDDYLRAIFPEDTNDTLTLAAPPSPQEQHIRASLLPNLCKAVADNLRYYDEFSLFETAMVYWNKNFTKPYDPTESLPYQRRNAVGAIVGDPENIGTLYRTAKGIIEALPRYTHCEALSFAATKKPIWAEDTLWQNILSDGETIGSLGLLSKKASLDCGIKRSAVMLFEFDLDSLIPFASRTNKFTALPEYPMTDYDVSLVFNSNIPWSEIHKTALDTVTDDNNVEKLLQNVSFVDEYRGQQVPVGKKSITLRMLIGSMEKTLTSAEIESCANTVIRRLTNTLGAELRG
ncbi:MAG: phenylalanine--tRNA ligase subunit beta [Oscillospiraceae bacterium]|nr:phenylalanine--tRNA ligase subunit beta [Oscillospiraceae bacterium]